LPDHGYRASAPQVMPVYSRAFTGIVSTHRRMAGRLRGWLATHRGGVQYIPTDWHPSKY